MVKHFGLFGVGSVQQLRDSERKMFCNIIIVRISWLKIFEGRVSRVIRQLKNIRTFASFSPEFYQDLNKFMTLPWYRNIMTGHEWEKMRRHLSSVKIILKGINKDFILTIKIFRLQLNNHRHWGGPILSIIFIGESISIFRIWEWVSKFVNLNKPFFHP